MTSTLPGISQLFDATSGDGWSIARGDVLLRLAELPSEIYDGVLTDVPYSSGGQFRGDRNLSTTSKYQTSDSEAVYPDFYGDTRDQLGFMLWVQTWLAQAWRVCKPGAVFGTWIDWRMLASVQTAIQAAGWTLRGIAVWRKTIARRQLGRFAQEAEFFPWASKGAMPMERDVPALRGAWEPEDAPYGPDDVFGDRAAGWWNLPPVGEGREHLTEKPVALMRDLCKAVTPGGHILDMFAGAGTTAVAARLEGRTCDLLELSSEYSAISARRMAEFDARAARGAFATGQGALFGTAPPPAPPATPPPPKPRPPKGRRRRGDDGATP